MGGQIIVSNANQLATAVWGYSNRQLTSLNTGKKPKQYPVNGSSGLVTGTGGNWVYGSWSSIYATANNGEVYGLVVFGATANGTYAIDIGYGTASPPTYMGTVEVYYAGSPLVVTFPAPMPYIGGGSYGLWGRAECDQSTSAAQTIRVIALAQE